MATYTLSSDAFAAETAEQLPQTGSKFDDWRCELDSYYTQMRDFGNCDARTVFLTLAAFSARASEMRSILARDESRRALALRSREVEPFIEECERQFRFHSRAFAVAEMEFKMSGGAI